MKTKLKILLPILLVFVVPWFHRLAFDNIMWLFPDAEKSGTHFLCSLFDILFAATVYLPTII